MNDAHRAEKSRSSLRGPGADERLKDRWGAHLAWSMILAVLVHASVFVLAPAWDLFDPSGDDLQQTALELIAADLRAPSGGQPLATSVPTAMTPDSASDDAGTASGSDGSSSAAPDPRGEESGSASGSLERRLRGASAPSPTVTERARSRGQAVPPVRNRQTSPPEPDSTLSPRDESESADDGRTPIGGRAAAAEVTDTSANRSPDLNRLRGLSPDVTGGVLSSELLLRNPEEVVGYMRSVSRRERMVTDTEAWLQLTIWVDESGSVEWAEVSQSSGREELDQVALTLFREIVAFRPALEKGKRVPKSMIFQVQFPW